MAEREGFEPPVGSHLRLISSYGPGPIRHLPKTLTAYRVYKLTYQAILKNTIQPSPRGRPVVDWGFHRGQTGENKWMMSKNLRSTGIKRR